MPTLLPVGLLGQAGRPRRTRRLTAVLLGVPLGVHLGLAGATSTAGATGTGGAEPGSGAGIARTAARVRTLTAEYRERSAAASAAAARLAAAYAEVAAADGGALIASQETSSAQALHAARIREIYALGAAASGGLALLAADDPDDALWQLAVGRPVAARLLRHSADGVRSAQAAEQGAAVRTARAVQALSSLSSLLSTLRDQQDAASAARDAARAELRRLTAAARQAARDAALAREAAQLSSAQAAAESAAASSPLAATGPVAALPIPAAYLLAYQQAAATCPGLDWTLLAAIGQVESGHGRNQGPSSAGAIGPMQFMPSTFAAYAADGDADGRADPWNPRDAIFTAARYLCASGAGRGPAGVHAAVFAYNHAEWYVALVLAARTSIRRAVATQG